MYQVKQLSEHFKSSELACKCGCGADEMSPELIQVLEEARSHFNSGIVINSGRRCATHNAKVGGAKHSQHLLGTAADVRVIGVEPKVVADYFHNKYPTKYGVGRYSTFTHIDVRPMASRWRQVY